MPRQHSKVNIRQDLRPEAYDIARGTTCACIACLADIPPKGAQYPAGEVFIVNPHDNPVTSGVECTLCKEHLKMFLPLVVIVNPHDWSERDIMGRPI
jgi:hypothetical protein